MFNELNIGQALDLLTRIARALERIAAAAEGAQQEEDPNDD